MPKFWMALKCMKFTFLSCIYILETVYFLPSVYCVSSPKIKSKGPETVPSANQHYDDAIYLSSLINHMAFMAQMTDLKSSVVGKDGKTNKRN